MPRLHRRSKRKTDVTTKLSWFLNRELLTGIAGPVRFPDLDTMRAAWHVHREKLRDKWAETREPGTRCFAEWLFEIVPEFGERPTTEHWEGCRREAWEKHGILHTHAIPPMQEPEHEFLYRHGLIDYLEYEEARELAESRAATAM